MNILFVERKLQCVQCGKQGPGVKVGIICYCRPCFEDLRESVRLLGPSIPVDDQGIKGAKKW